MDSVTEWGVRYTWPDGTGHTTRYAEEMVWGAAEHCDLPGVTASVVSHQVTTTPWETDPAFLFPVPGDRVKCGLRADLPKKQRRHDYVSLGLDVRNCGEQGFLERKILACRVCGTDKAVAA